jgi:hypothetical protein
MAITALEHMVLTSFREHQILPPHPRVLELGESNWYGDVTSQQLQSDIDHLVEDPADRQRLLLRLREITAANRPEFLYEMARLFWEISLQQSEYSAVDPGTPGSKYRFDLNLPLPIDDQFDLVINIGTAEHIFNVYQFFKTAHDHTKIDGLMMHSSPFTGWLNHGFFNFQPTFFFDLARANGYELISFICGRINPLQYVQVMNHDDIPRLIKAKKIPDGSHINVLMRKKLNAEFQVPVQAYYAGMLSAEAQKMWLELR